MVGSCQPGPPKEAKGCASRREGEGFGLKLSPRSHPPLCLPDDRRLDASHGCSTRGEESADSWAETQLSGSGGVASHSGKVLEKNAPGARKRPNAGMTTSQGSHLSTTWRSLAPVIILPNVVLLCTACTARGAVALQLERQLGNGGKRLMDPARCAEALALVCCRLYVG